MRTRVQRWSPTSISEYTYGLCATIEIVNRLGGMKRLIAAPLVPSLQQEADLGFDLALEGRWLLLCFPFKIPTQLVRGNAGEAAVMGTPYFRFHVKTNATSNGRCQHNTLCELEQLLSSAGEHVLYSAPIFDTHRDLSSYARSHTLVEHSVFVPPISSVVRCEARASCGTSVSSGLRSGPCSSLRCACSRLAADRCRGRRR